MEWLNDIKNDVESTRQNGDASNDTPKPAALKAVPYQLDTSSASHNSSGINDESSVSEKPIGQHFSPGQSPPEENTKGFINNLLNNSDAMKGEIDPHWRKETGRNNSYSGGKIKKGGSLNTPQKYNGNIESNATKEDIDLYIKLINTSMSLFGNVLGVQPMSDGIIEKFESEAKARYEREKQMIRYEIGHFESQIEYLEGTSQTAKIKDFKKRLKKSKADLKKLEDGEKNYYHVLAEAALSISGKVVSYGVSLIEIASAFQKITYNASPEKMNKIADKGSKINQAIKVGKSLSIMCERSQMDAFISNPNFETAQAWAEHVGSVFVSLSGIASGLPMGWDTVISKSLKMPKVVISVFSGMVKSRYDKMDQLTKIGGKGKILPDGTYG